ncbi:unnamed protein product [Brachionus calyciflorus]|uniref:Uncharacterized protein n=1 Tax=Brachionus calyciflorus TaxID=104777 RepID=A0A814H8G4_9BILA|nr:unnamed protein product [Brachionus calyciflorus]
MVIVKKPDESIVLLCLLTITIVLYKWFTRGRNSTPQSSSTTISRLTNLYVYNTMQLDMERNEEERYNRDGMDIHSWFTVLEIYLKKFQWVEITLSNIENKVLRKLKNLTIFLLSTNGYEELKKELISIYTVNIVETPINFSKLSMVKQSLNESISDFGRSVIGMVNKLFPSVNECNDIDKIMQERFAEGLSDKKLREKVRSKII